MVLGAAFSVGLGLYFLRDVLSQSPVSRDLPKIGSYSAYTLLAFLFLTLLYNLDVLLVKCFFTDLEAGYYMAAATIARMVFFGSTAIAGAMFPKVAAWNEAGNGDTARELLRDALLYTGVLAGLGAFFLNTFPRFAVSLLFGGAYIESAHLVGPLSIAMLFLSLSYVLSLYELALGARKFLYALMVGCLIQSTGIVIFHGRLGQVALVMIVAMASVFGLMVLLKVRCQRENTLCKL
ncbi:MAG: hypothetical protein DRG83_05570 [Deltaproteobacteria bacterium]|nr:MAG: hypothetical protein DRG83_05570 [Deltaproteobacteria bacterium]